MSLDYGVVYIMYIRSFEAYNREVLLDSSSNIIAMAYIN